MALLLPPPALNFLPSILCARISGGIVMAAQIFPLCRLLPLTIVITFFLPSRQKHHLTATTFVPPLNLKEARCLSINLENQARNLRRKATAVDQQISSLVAETERLEGKHTSLLRNLEQRQEN